jgi:hypothetical protein
MLLQRQTLNVADDAAVSQPWLLRCRLGANFRPLADLRNLWSAGTRSVMLIMRCTAGAENPAIGNTAPVASRSLIRGRERKEFGANA